MCYKHNKICKNWNKQSYKHMLKREKELPQHVQLKTQLI